MNKHFSWSSSGELWGLSETEGIISFLLFPDMIASGRLFNTKELQIWVQHRRHGSGVDGPLTLSSICHSLTLKLMWCLTQQRDELKQGNADSPLWILTSRDFSSCSFTLGQPRCLWNLRILSAVCVLAPLLKDCSDPGLNLNVPAEQLNQLFTSEHTELYASFWDQWWLPFYRKEWDRPTFLVVFLFNVCFCSVLQCVNILWVWLEDFAAHWDGSASLLTLVRTQTATLFVFPLT